MTPDMVQEANITRSNQVSSSPPSTPQHHHSFISSNMLVVGYLSFILKSIGGFSCVLSVDAPPAPVSVSEISILKPGIQFLFLTDHIISDLMMKL